MTTTDDAAATLDRLRTARDLAATLDFYDSLPAVGLEEMLGRWRGSGLDTGHPLDGLLERLGWYGKRFATVDDVHPLVFAGRGGAPVSLDPALMPLGLVQRFPGLARTPGAAAVFAALRPLLATTRPTARLRMTEYRGVVSATMCYDALAIHDVFRRIDARRVLGAMDLRGSPAPLMFVLTRADAGLGPA